MEKEIQISSKDARRIELEVILSGMMNSGNCSREEIILMGAYFGANIILDSTREFESINEQEVLHEIYMTYNDIYPHKFTLSDMRKIRINFLKLLQKDQGYLRSYIQDVIISNVVIK